MFAVEEEEGAPPPAAEAAPPQQPQPQPPGAEKNRQEPLNNNNTSSDSEPVLIASSAPPPPPPPPQQWRHHPLSSTDETPSTIPSVNEATPARGEQEGNDISAMGVSAISPDGYGDSGGDGVVDEVEVSKLTRSTILDALQADPSRPHGTARAAAAPPAPAEPPAAPAPASAAAVAEEEPATPISEAHRENIPASVDQLASFFSAPSLTHPVVAPPSSSVASSELSSVMMQRMPPTADAGVASEARAIVTETASEASSPDNRSRPDTSVPTDALRDAVSAADTSRLDVPGRSLMDEEEATAAQSRTEGGGRRFFSFNGDTDEEEADIRATSQRPSPPQQARDQQQHQQQPKHPVQRPLWGEGRASRDSDPDHPSHLLPTSQRTPPSLLLSDRVGHGPRGRDPLAPGRSSVSPTRGAQALPADASLFVTPYSEGVGAALSAPETSRQDDDRDLSLSTPSGGRQPSGNTGANSNSAAMVAQPTNVSAIIGGLYRAEAQKHMRTIVEVERESRIAMEDAFMRRWWEIVVEEAAAFGALPQALPLIRQRGRRRRRADGADAWPPSPEAKEETTMPAERSPLRLALPSTTHAYNFNLPKQWGGGVGTSHADSRHAPRRLVSPHAGIPQQHRGRRHGSGESAEDDDDDDDLPCGGLLDRSRTLSPKNSEAPAKWRREKEVEAEQGEGRADPDSSRVSGRAWAAMRLHAAESISANVYALSADEILYRSYLEDKERESFYLLVRVHQCVVDALQPAHLHLMQESARRAIEAERRRDERRIREYYGYATVEQELNHFRDAVRQRAVLVELEGKIRCDVIPVDEARERGQLAELFHLGLAGLVQQQEAVRAALDVHTREALEELVYSENRVREGVRVAEVRGRALLYQAAAHNARRRDGSPSLREEGKNVERQIDFAAAAAQTEEERRREEGDSSSSSTPPRGADALPDVEYYVDDSGNLRTRLSLTQTEEEGRSDGQAERQFFEWNPTSNTNTSHSAIHTSDEANQDQRAGGGSPSGADNSGVERAQRSPSPRARSVRSDKDAAASPEERPRSQTVVVADAREAEASALMHALQRTTAANHQQQRRTHHHRKSSSSGSSNRGEDASSCGSDNADFGGLLSDQTATAVGRDDAKPAAVKAPPPERHQSPNDRGKKPGRGLSGSPPANRHVVPCSLRPYPHRSYQSLLANGVGAVVAPSSPSISPQRRRQASGSPRRPYDESTLYACSPTQLRLLDSQRRRHHDGDPANWSTEEVVGDSPLDSTSLDSSPVSRMPLPPRPDPDADCAEVYVISPRRSARAVSSPLKRADSDEPLCNEVELSPPSPEASPARGHVSPRRRSPGYLAPTAASLRQRQSTALMRVLQQQEEAVGERTGQRHGAAARTPLRKAAQCSQSRRVRFHADATAAVGLGGAAVTDSLRAASPLLVTRVPRERGAGAWPATESPRNPYGLGGQAARVLAASHDRTHSAVVLPTPRPTRRQGSRDRRRRSPSVGGGEVTTQVVACATLTDRDEDGDNELADHFEGCPPRVVRGPTSLGQRRKAQREVSSQGGGGGGGGGTPLPRQRAERVGRSPQPRRTPRPSPLPPSSYAHALREQSREAVNRRLGRLADACVAASGPPLRELAPPSPNLTRHSDTPSQNSYVGLHSGGAYWPGVVPHERSSKSFPQVPQKPTDARALRNGPSAGRQLRQPSPPSSNLSGSGFVTQPNGERTWMYGSPFFAAAIPQRRQA